MCVALQNVEKEIYQGASNLPELKLQRGPLVGPTNQLEYGEETELINRLYNQISPDIDHFSDLLGFHEERYIKKKYRK